MASASADTQQPLKEHIAYLNSIGMARTYNPLFIKIGVEGYADHHHLNLEDLSGKVVGYFHSSGSEEHQSSLEQVHDAARDFLEAIDGSEITDWPLPYHVARERHRLQRALQDHAEGRRCEE